MPIDSNLQEAFPRYPYSIGSLRRTLWYMFSRHGGSMNGMIFITLVVGVAHIFVHNEFVNEEIGLLAYRTICVIVFCVSVLCCYCYIKLIYNFRFKLLYEQCQRCGGVFVLQPMVALFCLGILSIYSHLQQVLFASSKAPSTNTNLLWKTTFTAAAFVGVLQRFLSTIFICIVLPVSKRWVDEMKPTVQSTVLELLPWTIFLLLNRHMSPFFEKPLSSLEFYEDSVYIVGIGFHCFSLIWLIVVALYVSYDISITCKYDSQARGRKELAGVSKTVLNYPAKSQIVTGLSQRHYTFRYRGFPSNEDAERETKAHMRNNAIMHAQCRILFSQLD